MVVARLDKVVVGDGRPTVIIGAINLSDSSFYPGSVVRGRQDIIRRAREMVKEGAQIIDIGAMATGPKSMPVSEKQEIRMLIPAIKAVAAEVDVPVSADTQRAAVAEAAAAAGASIINDVSGLKADERMAEVISKTGCSAILMAARKFPGDVYTISEIREALLSSLNICRRQGLSLKKVVVDPAFGQWPARLSRLGPKTRKKLSKRGYSLAASLDFRILAKLKEIKAERPICVGISRKSSIGEVLNLPDPAARLFGSLAAAAIAVLNGAHALRTHDPMETVHAARVAEAIRDAVG
ncbi:MAG: dihydropteroate synthase [Candidatus Hadarchaeum sp.]|uniref:dihydropteroate synthase n=1 Tax=Candidatus Hadarchaeum sp. TaxID=2883567 RepID=UPI003D0BD21F